MAGWMLQIKHNMNLQHAITSTFLQATNIVVDAILNSTERILRDTSRKHTCGSLSETGGNLAVFLYDDIHL